MPAVRPNSSQSRRSKALEDPTPKSSSSRRKGSNAYACYAWWCDRTFTRRADMMRHVTSEHFGKRFCCPACGAVMKQEVNLNTHLNQHYGNRCTLCSCGKGFTDPSACTRHRKKANHAKGANFGQPRPTVSNPIKIQHLAGLTLTVDMIADPAFVPPKFDDSYHRRGLSRLKEQEKYNPIEYLWIDQIGAPTAPSTQATGMLSTDGTPAAQYQEPPAPPLPQTDIWVEDFHFNIDLSYEVELSQDHPSPQPFAGSHVSPEYLETFLHLQASDYASGSTPPSLDVSPPHDFCDEMGFGMHGPESFPQPQFQSIYQPNANFNNYSYYN